MTDITTQDLQQLVIYFSKNTYKAKDADSEVIIYYVYYYTLIIYIPISYFFIFVYNFLKT